MDKKIHSHIQMDETKGLSTIFETYSAKPISFEIRPLEVADEKDNSAWIRK
ncbi:MAG TPA: hypothetical protein VER14_03425 [Phototrophicaceae bacterium]|nr:hypothetical protein [Phototrophicaceae bacterium]